MKFFKNKIKIKNKIIKKIKKIKNENDLNNIKVKFLGRNGFFNKMLKFTKKFPIEEKKEKNKILNELKKDFLHFFYDKSKEIKNLKKKKYFDITLPFFNIKNGKEHVINKNITILENYFRSLNFECISGYEIDSINNNFDSLNMDEDHPSRSLTETFYLNNKILLRTHTSNMQIHYMKKHIPPFRVISYGKVFRRDSDISHTPMFHQLEGFFVDKNISISNLKFFLKKFLNFYFERDIKYRLRPSYFPFTEPSLEVDINCINCLGKLCSLCKYSGWIEILGCGIINPIVLKKCNINNKFTGFAFGLGIERLAIIKHKINDIRLLYENNIDFLDQF